MERIAYATVYAFSDPQIHLLRDLGFVEYNQFESRSDALELAKTLERGTTVAVIHFTRDDFWSVWYLPA